MDYYFDDDDHAYRIRLGVDRPAALAPPSRLKWSSWCHQQGRQDVVEVRVGDFLAISAFESDSVHTSPTSKWAGVNAVGSLVQVTSTDPPGFDPGLRRIEVARIAGVDLFPNAPERRCAAFHTLDVDRIRVWGHWLAATARTGQEPNARPRWGDFGAAVRFSPHAKIGVEVRRGDATAHLAQEALGVPETRILAIRSPEELVRSSADLVLDFAPDHREAVTYVATSDMMRVACASAGRIIVPVPSLSFITRQVTLGW